MNISNIFIGCILAFGLVFSSCGGGSSGTTVTAVDGYIKDAIITDSAGQTGVYTSDGQYTFANTITYPLTLTGGLLEDTNASFDINMTAQEGQLVVSPITTFLENNSTLLGKLANLGLANNPATFSDFSVDYVDVNNTNLAKLSQLLYAAHKDTTLLNAFKVSLSSNDPASLNEIFTLLETDVNATMGIGYAPSYIAFLDKVESLNVTASAYETELKQYKLNMNTDSSSVTHNGTTYGTVVSPYTGKVWLDRNLGASQVCTDLNATACYGDYYQWGRNYNGHQESNSTTTVTLSSDINSSGSSFITNNSSPYDWADNGVDDNGTLRTANWSKTDGTSVCPIGYRVPTIDELTDETISEGVVNYIDAFNNFLKLPSAGARGYDGSLYDQGIYGYIWLSSVNSTKSHAMLFYDSDAFTYNDSRANASSVRCLKD
jgi:hypothetical protein